MVGVGNIMAFYFWAETSQYIWMTSFSLIKVTNNEIAISIIILPDCGSALVYLCFVQTEIH